MNEARSTAPWICIRLNDNLFYWTVQVVCGGRLQASRLCIRTTDRAQFTVDFNDRSKYGNACLTTASDRPRDTKGDSLEMTDVPLSRSPLCGQ